MPAWWEQQSQPQQPQQPAGLPAMDAPPAADPFDEHLAAIMAWKPTAALPTPPAPHKEKPLFSLDNLPDALWDAGRGMVNTLPASGYRAYYGTDRPDTQSESARAAYRQESAFNQEMADKTAAAQAAGTSDSTSESIREAAKSLGFTGISMGATALGGMGGGALGSLASPGIGTAAGIGAGMVASGKLAYNMAANQLLTDAFDQLEAKTQKEQGRGMTEQEKQAAYDELLPVAQNTGLWEAGPEAIGNALTLGAGKFIFSRLGPEAIQRIAGRAGALLGKPAEKLIEKGGAPLLKGGAIAGDVAQELGMEGWTQQHQGNDQARVDAYLSGLPMSEAAQPYADGLPGWWQGVKDVAPVVLATMGLMGGSAAVGQQIYRRIAGQPEAPQGLPSPDSQPTEETAQPTPGGIVPTPLPDNEDPMAAWIRQQSEQQDYVNQQRPPIPLLDELLGGNPEPLSAELEQMGFAPPPASLVQQGLPPPPTTAPIAPREVEKAALQNEVAALNQSPLPAPPAPRRQLGQGPLQAPAVPQGMPQGQVEPSGLARPSDELNRLIGPSPALPAAPGQTAAPTEQDLNDLLTRPASNAVSSAPLAAQGPITAPATAPVPRPKLTQAEIKARQGQRNHPQKPIRYFASNEERDTEIRRLEGIARQAGVGYLDSIKEALEYGVNPKDLEGIFTDPSFNALKDDWLGKVDVLTEQAFQANGNMKQGFGSQNIREIPQFAGKPAPPHPADNYINWNALTDDQVKSFAQAMGIKPKKTREATLGAIDDARQATIEAPYSNIAAAWDKAFPPAPATVAPVPSTPIPEIPNENGKAETKTEALLKPEAPADTSVGAFITSRPKGLQKIAAKALQADFNGASRAEQIRNAIAGGASVVKTAKGRTLGAWTEKQLTKHGMDYAEALTAKHGEVVAPAVNPTDAPLTSHYAIYGDKVVAMDYAEKPADQFKLAGMRIRDNGADGYVVTPKREVFRISQSNKIAKRVTDPVERQQALERLPAKPAAPVELVAPDQVNKPAKATKPAKPRPSYANKIALRETDDLLTAIAKMGGIDQAIAKREGVDPSEFKRMPVFGKPLFRKTGGRGMDAMAEVLAEAGYPVLDENGHYTVNRLLDQLDSALRGERIYTPKGYEDMAQRDAEDQQRQQEADDWALDDVELAESGFNELTDSEQAIADWKVNAREQLGADRAESLFERIAEKSNADSDAEFLQELNDAYARELEASRGHRESPPRNAPEESGRAATAASPEDLTLSGYSQADLDARAAEVARAQAEQAAKDKAADQKAAADRARDGFTLSGSNRPADIAIAAGQKQMFAATTPPSLTAQLKTLSSDATVQALINNGRLKLVAKQTELPRSARIPPGQRVAGWVDPQTGVVYLVTDNITQAEVDGLLSHEIGVHQSQLGLNQPKPRALRLAHALVRLLGGRAILGDPAFEQVLKQVEQMRAAGNVRVVAAFEDAQKAAGKLNQSPALLREEALAYLVQNQPQLPLVRRIMAAIRAMLYRMGLNISLTEADLRALAQSAVRRAATERAQPDLKPINAVLQRAAQAPQDVEAQRQFDAVVARYILPDGTKAPGWMKAPNGQPTKLNERQWVQVRTENFKRWFGDFINDPATANKVIDENGEPLVVFHSGNNDFSEIKIAAGSVGGIFALPDRPANYRDTSYPLFLRGEILSLEKMDDLISDQGDGGVGMFSKLLGRKIDDDVAEKLRDSLTNGEHYPDSDNELVWEVLGIIDEADAQKEIQKLRGKVAKELGFGSVQTPDEFDGETILIISPTDIKSAIGNTGAFSPTNPDMRYATAWHGTPHTFEAEDGAPLGRFRMEKLGTGEGAQVFGHGLYFTEKRKISEGYRDSLSAAAPAAYEWRGHRYEDGPIKHALSLIYNDGLPYTRKLAKQWANDAANNADEKAYFQTLLDTVNNVDSKSEIKQHKGRLYQAHLKPADDAWLLWDKPLTAQSKRVKAAIEGNATLKSLAAERKDDGSQKTGEDLYRELSSKQGGDQSASDYLATADIPGMKYLTGDSRAKGKGDYNYVVFRDDDVEVMQRFALARPQPALGTPPQVAPPPMTRVEMMQRAIQDKFVRFKTIQHWLKQLGVNLTPDADVYGAEERSVKRFAAKAEDFRKQTVRPLVQAAGKAGYRVTGGDLIGALLDRQPLPTTFKPSIPEYLIARHAPKRNASIAKINPKYPDGGSGLTNAQAAAIMAKYQALPGFAGFAQQAEQFSQISEGTKKLLLSAGLLSADQVAAWDAAYGNTYVPLMGGPEDAPAHQGTGPGQSVNARQRRALGHDLREENVIENIFRAREKALMEIEKNQVGLALRELLLQTNNPNIGTVGQPEKKAVLAQGWVHEVWVNGRPLGAYASYNDAKAAIAADSATTGRPVKDYGVRHKASDPGVIYMTPSQLADNEATVYLNGERIRMQINDPDAARAYNALGVDAATGLIKAGATFNRYLSKAYTGFNPEFLAVNIARDLTAGLINLTGKYGAGFAAKAIKNYLPAMRETWRFARDKGNHAWVDRYRAAGGSTGAAYLSDLERLGTDLTHAFQDAQGAAAVWKEGKKGAALRVASADMVQRAFGWLERMNMAGENAMRVATFRAVIEAGGTDAEAASAAANVTVNFNRRGEMGQQLSALYLFFNPNVQGTQVLLDTLLNSPHKAQAWAAAGALAGLAFALAGLARGGGDEDEKKWRTIPAQVKDRNLILKMGDEQITIPVPFGYGVFWSLGNILSDLAHGADDGRAGYRLASALFQHFSPIGNPLAGDEADFKGVGQLLPTVARMPMEVALNRSGLGAPIRPETPAWNPGQPDSQAKWRSSSGNLYDRFAVGMNRLTGGSAYESGFVDVSPETWKTIVRDLTGGAGQFVADSLNLGATIVQGGTPTIKELPIVRKFVREETIQDARTYFHDQAQQVKIAIGAFNAAKRAKDMAGVMSLAHDKAELIRLGSVLNATNKLIQAQRMAQQQILAGDNPLPVKRAQLKAMESQESAIYDRFDAIFIGATARRQDSGGGS